MKKICITKSKKIILITACVLLIAVVGFFAAYVSDYYHADSLAISAFKQVSGVSVTSGDKGELVYSDEQADVGLIFYPGGKVDYSAYEPLMKSCAAQGILCIVPQMPFNLAVFDIDAAKEIRNSYPEIKRWYIGGHSLGGSMAASFVSENSEAYEGLILLASYSTADLSDSSLKVLSVLGSNDKVLDREKYQLNRQNLPDDFTEVVIEGGCHAYFGTYGLQEGDGTAIITNEQQIDLTARHIGKFINGFS